MANGEQFEVLRNSRSLLKILNWYNKDGVHIRALPISDFIVFLGILSPMLLFTRSVISQCIDENFNLKATSLGVACGITTFQLTYSFITLAMNTDIVVENIDHLDATVKKSFV